MHGHIEDSVCLIQGFQLTGYIGDVLENNVAFINTYGSDLTTAPVPS